MNNMYDEIGSDLVKIIKKDVKRVKDKVAKRAAELAEDDLNEAREQIISEFYEYKGKSDRTENNRNGGLWNATKTNINGNGLKYNVSLILDGANMDGNYGQDDYDTYDITGDYVSDLIWNQGIRGLPQKGKNPLHLDNGKKSYNFMGHTFYDGKPWKNPYWKPSIYHNNFKPKIKIGKYKSKKGTPDSVMNDFINRWGITRMDEIFDQAMDEILKEK